MKVKNEIKIAFVAIVGVVILFFGMQFLKGMNLFSSETIYLMKFDNISGMSTSSPIYANGYRVGTVKTINYDYQHHDNITVDVSINKDMAIPEGTQAEIVSDMLGNVQVNLLLGESKTNLKPGGIITGVMNNGALGEVKSMIPTIQAMLPKLDSIMGHINHLLADPAIASSLHNVNRITSDLTTSTQQLNTLLASLNKDIPGLTGKASHLLDHADGTMQEAGKMVAALNHKVDGIDVEKTMGVVNEALGNVQKMTQKLNSNDNTLGLLMNDQTLYTNLTKTANDADSLLKDLKDHPKRYVHFSIFGKKDKK